MLKISSPIILFVCMVIGSITTTYAENNKESLPIVPEGFVVDVVAKEPLVSNPSVMAFDQQGRIFIGQGPQWRSPSPQSPGDHVDLLIDDNGDGLADRVKKFAEGFNCIQGLVWKGRDLWVANSPDLTIVRDLDGDDEADEYVRIFTGLGNLEHALHGLNYGPDGKLYMSKGNSKGYNRLDQLAPKAFRDLWGIPSPEGAPDYPPIEVFKKAEYRKNYHTPADDWGQQGGILKCDSNGRNLEIVSRGFRNPWDITFDDGFNWIGTDNDQTQGDKIFSPFYGANFGWGHPWSYHWTGNEHLPTVPMSAPLFEGSGTGVIHYHAEHFPQEFRNVFFVNDWLRREVYLFQPQWKGALLKSKGEALSVFAHANGGRSSNESSGIAFDPTDIEVGPDGALYILSWGHSYGATIKAGKQVDVGRVYRIRHESSPLISWNNIKRTKPLTEWSNEELFEDLGNHVPAWRVNAQNEFVRRGDHSKTFLFAKFNNQKLTKAQSTWTLWTIGRLSGNDSSIDKSLELLAGDAQTPENIRIQALRILAFRIIEFGKKKSLPVIVKDLLMSENPRIRHESLQAIWQTKQSQWVPYLLELAAKESDRVVFYSTWNALRNLATLKDRNSWLNDNRAGIKLAALLGLFEENLLSAEEVLHFRGDSDPRISALVESWLEKTGGAEPIVSINPPPGEYTKSIAVTLKTSIPNGNLKYTLDGSTPVKTSNRYTGPITINENTILSVAVEKDSIQTGPVTRGNYQIRHIKPYEHRPFITKIKAQSDQQYQMDWTGLNVGKRYYTDRSFEITEIPEKYNGLPFLQTANQDDRSSGKNWVSLASSSEVTVYIGVDVRVNKPLDWMRTEQPDGFVDTKREIVTTDSKFRIFKKHFPAGEITFGGNTNSSTDSGRGNYIVFFDRPVLHQTAPNSKPVTMDEVLAIMSTADIERGRELFLHPKGAGCFKCHQMEGLGSVFAPDLSDIGSRAKNPQVLIESIIKPSAVITEGFSQQTIVTGDGILYRGAVLEETGLVLKIVNSQGEVTTISKTDIDERIGTKISSMPAGFDKMMTAQQIADLTAWLMTQKVVGDRNGFSFQDKGDQLEIFYGKQRIATYVKKSSKITRQAFVNVTTLTGIQVTRDFPTRIPDDQDHEFMHPGIWMSFGDLNGNDYWRLKSEVVFEGFVDSPTGDKRSASFSVRSHYMSEDKSRVICSETTRSHFYRVADGVLIHHDTTFYSDEQDFYFGDQEESGLGIRVASPIRVQGGNGAIINDKGKKNAKAMWGQEAKWFDYYGTINNRKVGIMVVSNPNNPRPSWLHARDYGVVVTNPFPKQPKERREPYIKTWVKKGEPYRISHTILIHDLPASKTLDRDAAYREALEYHRNTEK